MPRAPEPAPSGDAYPAFARGERIADGVLHLLANILAPVGAVLLIVFAALHSEAPQVAAVSAYAGAMMLSFAASALYHMTPWERFRPLFRRLDHAAIYLKIAGTYTPFVVLVGSAFAYLVLGLVWVLALAGAALKFLRRVDSGPLATIAYLALGWLSLLLIWPMATTLPLAALICILAGGLLYSCGVIFFRWESLRYSNAIWHGFVLAASGCFFAAVATGTFVTG